MQIGVIGLGRMGGNMSRRLMKAGHTCVVFDANAKPREALAKEGATAVKSLEDLVKALKEKPRAVWVMLPAGQITEETVERLGGLLEPDDIIIDGGNSFYKDDIRRAKKLADKRIRYVDCGTSGGVWGIDRGYCMMIGGPNSGVFLQITCDDPVDIDVPGHSYSFGVVKAAQASGDLEVLVERGRRALRIHLKDVDAGLAELARAMDSALE